VSGVVSLAFAAHTWSALAPPFELRPEGTVNVIDVLAHEVMLELGTVSVPPTMNSTQPVPAPPLQIAALLVATVPKFVPVTVMLSPLRPPSPFTVVVREVASGALLPLEEADLNAAMIAL